MTRVTLALTTSWIAGRILTLRGVRVMLDADLADIYGVSTKRLNEQFKRNHERFPPDFAFRLTLHEKKEVVANCDHLRRLKFAAALPYAFTEHGALMLASVLNSPRAVATSVQIVRAFVHLRSIMAEHRDLGRRLDELEARYDRQFKVVFDAIRALMTPNEGPRKRIGFRSEGGTAR
jgi:hypothetical protein